MTIIIQKLTAFLAWLLRSRSGEPDIPTRLEQPIRSMQLELEHARAGFDDAGRRVELLTNHLDRGRSEGRLNRGQLALMQRDLQQSARCAQAAFDRAVQVQDSLSVLQAAQAGGGKIGRTEPIPRASLEELLKKVVLAETQAEQYREVMQELHGAVYGVTSSDLENLPILAKESAVATPPPQKIIKVEPFRTNG